MKYFLFLIVLLGCAGRRDIVYDKVETREYILTQLDEPKHFYVYLTDVKTGKKYDYVYVSKHCNDWRELQIGKIYKLERVYWTDGGREYSDFKDLSCVFCHSCY